MNELDAVLDSVDEVYSWLLSEVWEGQEHLLRLLVSREDVRKMLVNNRYGCSLQLNSRREASILRAAGRQAGYRIRYKITRRKGHAYWNVAGWRTYERT